MSKATPPPPAMSSFAAMDRGLHGAQAKLTGGISPIAIGTALFDWSAHYANAPFRQVELAMDAVTRLNRLGAAALGGETITPAIGDYRFAAPAWQEMPFAWFAQAFSLAQEWTQHAVRGLPGVSPANERIVGYLADQWLLSCRATMWRSRGVGSSSATR